MSSLPFTGQTSEPRDVRLPIFANAHQDGIAKLKVQRVMPDGERHDLSYVPGDSDQDSIVARFRTPGSYYLTPCDDAGRMIGDFQKLVWGSDHPVLARLGPNPTNQATPAQASDPIARGFDLLEQRMRDLEANFNARTAILEEERKSLALERQKLSEERLAIASVSTNGALDIQTKLVDKDATRQERAMSELALMMENSRKADQVRADAMLAQVKADAEARVAEATAKANAAVELAKIELQMKKAELDSKEAERKDRLDREERERKETAKREKEERDQREEERKTREEQRERERGEHQRAMLGLMGERQKSNSPMGQFEQIGTMLGQMKKIGLIPENTPTPSDENPDSWPGMVAMLAKEGIRTWRETQLLRAKLLAAGINLDEMEEEGEEEGDDQPPQGQMGGAPPPGQIPGPTQGQPANPPVPATAVNPIVERAKNIPPEKQKRARRAMRYLFENLEKTPPDQRSAVIESVVRAEAEALLPYLYAVGLRNAMLETGATQDAISRVLFQLEESGKIPADLPRN